MRVALIHDWLTGIRGGEVVLEAIAELFPDADIFTLVHLPEKISGPLTRHKIIPSVLQKIPGIGKRYRYFLPLMPWAIKRLNLDGYDLILSSSHCVAKGVNKPKGSVHVSYIHAPMRYIWDRFDDYFGPGRASPHVRLAAKLIRSRLQSWDRKVSTPDRIDHLVANSRFIAGQIQELYGRESKVVHPYADLDRFKGKRRQPTENYLIVSALVPYKRIDVAVDAFRNLDRPLLIVGEGPERRALEKRAGPKTQFLGNLSQEAITDLYLKCRAFVFPGVEDFGITPVEALAAGAPILAQRAGGVLDTVTEETAVFFHGQALEGAVLRFEKEESRFHPEQARASAQQFSRRRFQREYLSEVQAAWFRSKKTLTGFKGPVQPSVTMQPALRQTRTDPPAEVGVG